MRFATACTIILLFLLSIWPIELSSQSKLDSFALIMSKADSDDDRIDICWSFYKQLRESDVAASVPILRSLKQYALRLNQPADLNLAHYEFGVQFYYLKQLDSSVYYLRLVADEAEGDSETKTFAYSLLGSVYAEQNLPDSAIKFHQKLLQATPSSGQQYVTTMHNLALAEYHIGWYDKALEHAREAKKEVERLGLKSLMWQMLSAEYGILISMGKPLPANASDELRASISAIENDVLRISAVQNLSVLMLDLGKVEEARELLNEVIEETKSEQASLEYPSLVTTLAEVEYVSGHPEKAVPLLRETLKRFPEYTDKAKVVSMLVDAFAALDMADSCAHYADLLELVYIEAGQRNLDLAVADLQENAEILKINHQLEANQKERQLLETQVTNQWLFIALGVATMLIMLTIGYVLYFRQRSLKQAREREVKEKNKELWQLSLRIAQKNEWINSIEAKLDRSQDKEEGMHQRIAIDVRNAAQVDHDWEQFSKYFEDQYEGFYERLKVRFPDLTNNDLRLCSLIRLRMTIKETASTLNLSIPSVKSSRYRLRKKLKLSPGLDLSDFLSEI